MIDPTSTPYTVYASPFGNGSYQGTFTLGAQNGTVTSFSVIVPTPLASWGYPTANPGSGGPLKSGGTVTITVTLVTFPRHQPVVLTVKPSGSQSPILVTVSPYNPIT